MVPVLFSPFELLNCFVFVRIPKSGKLRNSFPNCVCTLFFSRLFTFPVIHRSGSLFQIVTRASNFQTYDAVFPHTKGDIKRTKPRIFCSPWRKIFSSQECQEYRKLIFFFNRLSRAIITQSTVNLSFHPIFQIPPDCIRSVPTQNGAAHGHRRTATTREKKAFSKQSQQVLN